MYRAGAPLLARLRTDRGVTLTELAVTLALLGLIVSSVMAVWAKTQQAYFVGSTAAEDQQNVRAAIDYMVRELRSVGRDTTVCAFDYAGPTAFDCSGAKAAACQLKLAGGYTSCTNIFAIPYTNARATSIQILSDRNDNGTIAGTTNADPSDGGNENVLYQLASGSPPCPPGVPSCITRDDGTGPVAMVAVDIAGLTFTYYPRPGFPRATRYRRRTRARRSRCRSGASTRRTTSGASPSPSSRSPPSAATSSSGSWTPTSC